MPVLKQHSMIILSAILLPGRMVDLLLAAKLFLPPPVLIIGTGGITSMDRLICHLLITVIIILHITATLFGVPG